MTRHSQDRGTRINAQIMSKNQTERLTEQEKQEIVRYIEGNKPLPDKYRFLLFEDKREVELVWNGKSSEVCNIVLPFQVIEQVDEPRSEKDTRIQSSRSEERRVGKSVDLGGRRIIK